MIGVLPPTGEVSSFIKVLCKLLFTIRYTILHAISVLAHVRTGSAGSPMDINNIMQSEEDLRCIKISSHKAHQQAITVLDSEGGRVLTGSQDHTLKVYRYVTLFHNFYDTFANYAYFISN